MKKVVILGAGGSARETIDVFMACNERKPEYEIVGYIDENLENRCKTFNGFEVLGDFTWFDTVDRSNISVIVGIGNPASKKKVVEKATQKGLEFCNVIHPNVVMTPFVKVGHGIVITAGSVLTNRIVVGNHVFINLNCTISHDSVVEDYCNINPGVHISGNVHLGIGCEIGTGAALIQGIKIGPWTVIGAGAVVTDNIPGNVIAVGVPARVIKEREEYL